MSLHKSLKQKNALTRRRSVLTRAERVERLKEDERWEEGSDSVFGLPKIKPRIVVAPTSRRRAEEKAADEAEGTVEDSEAPEPEE